MIRKILFLCLALLIASGCSIKKYNIETVKKEIEKQGLEVASIDNKFEDFILRGIKPERVSLTSQIVKTDLLEEIDVYIFKSELERIKGRQEFDSKMAFIDLKYIPKLYETHNVLLVYWSKVKLGQKPVFDDQIINVIENME